MLGTLTCGYFGAVAVAFFPAVPGGAAAHLVPATGIETADGRVRFLRQPVPSIMFPNGGIHCFTRFRPARLPDLRRCLWEFDCHPLNIAGGGAYIVACPIWCVALPFLIAPALWLRKMRKRRVEPAGFGVIQQPTPRGLGAA